MKNKLLSEIRILIVDDSKDFRMLLRTMLRNLGALGIVETNCTHEALKHLGNMSVDLIVSDHYMPKSTGLELLAQVRQGSGGIDRSTPFVIISGEARKSNIIEAAKNGVDAYMIKPISPQAIEKKIKPIISGVRPLFDRWYTMNVQSQSDDDLILI